VRTVAYFLALLATLPLFWIVGPLIVDPLTEPHFETVDPVDPPLDLALLGAWSRPDGSWACRAFYHRDITAGSELLPPIRYSVSPEEFDQCSEAFRRYGRARPSPDRFVFDSPGHLARLQRPDPDDPDLFVVTYMADDDRFAETRYRVDPRTGRPIDFEFRSYFGPARGLAMMFLGVPVGTLAWIGLAVLLAFRRFRRGDEEEVVATGAPA